MARPLKDINWDMVEKKMEAGCTAREIYGNVCDEDTFYRRFKDKYGCSFGDYAGQSYQIGNGNLKFAQYMRALAGNNPMLQLLGKERLGQGRDVGLDPPRDDVLAITHENMLLKAEIEKMKAPHGNKYEAEPELRGSDTSIQYLGGSGELGQDVLEY